MIFKFSIKKKHEEKNSRREFIYSLQKRSIEKRVIAQGVLVHVLLSRHRILARFYARYRRIDADASVARASVDENGIKPRWGSNPSISDGPSLNAGSRSVQKN